MSLLLDQQSPKEEKVKPCDNKFEDTKHGCQFPLLTVRNFLKNVRGKAKFAIVRFFAYLRSVIVGFYSVSKDVLLKNLFLVHSQPSSQDYIGLQLK